MVEEGGDYDLLPHEEVIRLRREVEDIKAHPFGSTREGKELLEAITRLAESMDHLTGLFQEAAEQMKLEEREAEMIGKRLDPLFGQMGELIDQNKKIAKGIIAVADMVKEEKMRPTQRPYSGPPGIRVEPSPLPRASPAPQTPPAQPYAGPPPPMPPPGMQQGMPQRGMPPPPLMETPKKKGLFSFGK